MHTTPFIVTVPEQPEIVPEPDPTLTPTSPAEPTSNLVDEAQKRAEEIVGRIIDLQDRSAADDQIRILEEESGLDYELLITGTLLNIYLEERPDERGDPFSWYDIVLEYLRLGFVYPDANERELLEHFRQSVKDGRVTIDLDKSALIKKRRNQIEKQKAVISETHPISSRILKREIKMLQQYHLENIPLDLPAERDTIFMEEAGLSFDFVHNTLLAIHLEENPKDEKVVATGIYQHARLIGHYLFLRRTFDAETEGSILDRFRKNAETGNYTRIKLGAPLAAFQ